MAEQDGFGRAVAVGEDQVFVGAPRAMNNPGRVYSYMREEKGAWSEGPYLEARQGRVGDEFGSAIEVAGETLVVGAPSANAVYVFRPEESGWTQAARLTPADSTRRFGISLALQGDRLFVGSGATLAVQNEDTTEAGAVHLFQRSEEGQWKETGMLRSDHVQEEAGFGHTLTTLPEHLLVGAPKLNGGAVVAFRLGTDGWTKFQTLTAASLGSAAQFGATLQQAGDQLLVGAPRAFDATGAVDTYTYSVQDTTWKKTGRLLPFGGGPRHYFGSSLAYDGTSVWVGAPEPISQTFIHQWRAQRSWPGGTQPKNGAGALYRFRHDGDTWTEAERIEHPGAERGDGVGGTLSANASVVVAGLPGDDHGAGTVAFFSISDGTWTQSSPIAPTKGAVLSARTGEEQACSDGNVGPFSCEGVDLQAFLPIREIGGGRGVKLNDIWGWTDPKTGTEYALVGRTDGTAFVDVTDPSTPVYIGELPLTEGAQVNSWRDLKVYDDHVYVVADIAGDHGMQVFDLTQLRDVDPSDRPVTFEATAHYDKINSAHNVVINKESGYAYAVGSSGGGETCGGGLHMINLQEPQNPTFEGCFADPSTGRSGTGSTHDAQCVIYSGPDQDYQDHEICVGANETAISIADVTDKDNPVAISTASYPDHGYVHQGWFTEDQRYFYQNDELDEIQDKVEHTRTLVWDLADLDNPRLVNQLALPERSSDHNLYVEGDRMYQSNYNSGLRILDISDRQNPEELAHFDTKPYGQNAPGFSGTWSNYPYFESGIIVVTSIDEGVFVLEKPRQGL